MAGLEIDESAPGYRHIFVQPRPGGGFTDVKASHETMYGRASSAWTMADGRFELTVEVPANTRATVRLPGATHQEVTESGKPIADIEGVSGLRQEGDSVVVQVGSGKYKFSYPFKG
jgi:alpha-L-rhamnosidase